MKEYLNDYELLYLISEQSEEALNIFFEKYTQTINYAISQYFFSVLEKEDLLEEGYLLLYKAISLYDEAYQIPFYSYFTFIYNRYLKKFLIKKYQEKKMINDYILKMDLKEEVEYDYLSDYLIMEVANSAYSFLKHDMEKRIFEELIVGQGNFKAFAMKYSYNLKTVYNTYKKLCRRLKCRIFGEK